MSESDLPDGASHDLTVTPPRSALVLAALATVAVPGLDVVSTRHPRIVGPDVETTGVLDSTGRAWVVRAPRHAAAGADLEGEAALLVTLGHAVDDGELPFDVPVPAGFAPLAEGGRALVHRDLVGRPLPVLDLTPGPGLAAELGRALAALHELDTAVVDDAGLAVYDASTLRLRAIAEIDDLAQTSRIPAILLQRWERACEDVRGWHFRTTVVHGDLGAERVLVADGRVVALLDFTRAHVGDPATDLAWLLAATPPDAMDSVLEAYALARTEHSDPALVPRAQLASELALGRYLRHGLRHGDAEVVAEATAMIRELADAVDGADDIMPAAAG